MTRSVCILGVLLVAGPATADVGDFRVVVDPGHDPSAPGATSARGRPEVGFNDHLAAAVVRHLQAMTPRVTATVSREPDEGLTLPERLARIRSLDPDLVLSVHHDSVQTALLRPWRDGAVERQHTPDHRGYSLFVPTAGWSAEVSQLAARRLADALQRAGRRPTSHHAAAIPGEGRTWVDERLGIHAGDFLFLLRKLTVPVVLFEAGVILHREEEAELADPELVDRLAHAVATAVHEHLMQVDTDRLLTAVPGPRVTDAAIVHPDPLPGAPPLRWERLGDGLELARVPLYFRGRFVERVNLVRADLSRYRLGVFHSPEPRTVSEWADHLGAPVVVNGSFYENDAVFSPTTPILVGGRPLGPARYRSKHAALLAEPRRRGRPRARLHEFGGEQVDLSSLGYREAVVSYPLLVDSAGRVRAARNPRWRADRTFVALDRKGRLVLGTTHGGFFSLNRLGRTLAAWPGLELRSALNLDGGPPACMRVRAGTVDLEVLGRWESNDSTGVEVIYWGAEPSNWPLPEVIALFPRDG